jgi:CrcB protein
MSPDDRHDITAAQADIDPDLLAPRAPAGQRRAGHARPQVLLAIALGGAIGTPARYALGRIIHVAPDSFPWSTFTVNITGCFVLGLLLTFVIERWPPSQYVRPFAAIGVLGAYTTFSTYMVETDLLVKDGHVGVALAYVLGSLLAGIAAVFLGIVLGRSWPAGKEMRG